MTFLPCNSAGEIQPDKTKAVITLVIYVTITRTARVNA